MLSINNSNFQMARCPRRVLRTLECRVFESTACCVSRRATRNDELKCSRASMSPQPWTTTKSTRSRMCQNFRHNGRALQPHSVTFESLAVETLTGIKDSSVVRTAQRNYIYLLFLLKNNCFLDRLCLKR